jgi:hypothetical protein
MITYQIKINELKKKSLPSNIDSRILQKASFYMIKG